MTGRLLAFLALGSLLIVLCCGCGSGGQPESEAAAPTAPARPGLVELLEAPRADLNARAENLLAEIKTRNEARRQNKLAFKLLPRTYQPLVFPGIHDAKFHADLGYSLPVYVDPRETVPQPDLALLYAQYGDFEAAQKLARDSAPADLEKFKLDRNYPLEWTRYVTLLLHSLAQKIALGEADAFAEFVDTRKQMEAALDEKARHSPLGETLLALERRVIQQAAEVWRKQGDTTLANQSAGLIGSWAEREPTLPFDQPREFWVRALKSELHGQVISGTPALRALDFLQLPFPAQALEAALLFFDAEGKLDEVILGYNPRIQDAYPRAPELAGSLSDYLPSDPEASPNRCLQRMNGWTVETRLSPVDATVGAWVRFSRQRPSQPLTLARQLGPVHLDRSYDANRLHLAPTQLGNPLVLKDDAALDRVANPSPAGKLQEVVLEQTPNQNLVERARFRYRPGTPWHQVALPLFAQYGPGQWQNEPASGNEGPRLRIAWNDDRTELALKVPHEGRQAIELEFADRSKSEDLPARAAAVKAHEARERKERIDRGEAVTRLPRKLDYLPLGAPREEVLRYLPKGQTVFKREFDNGMLVVVNSPPPRDGAPYMVREIVVRFDPEQRLDLAQVRYDTASKPRNAKEADWPKALLEPWRQAGGAVAALPSPLAARSRDLPAQTSSGTFYRWEDDLTEATLLSDRNGVLVTLADRPADGKEPPPLVYLPSGPAEALPGLTLGMSRQDFLAAAKMKPVETPEGALAIGVAKGPYDAVLVWFDKQDRAEQITARFRQTDASRTGQKDLEKALTERWGAEIRQVGWPARRDYSPQGVLQSLTWFDDLTRYRLYWADTDNSPARLWAEWKGTP